MSCVRALVCAVAHSRVCVVARTGVLVVARARVSVSLCVPRMAHVRPEVSVLLFVRQLAAPLAVAHHPPNEGWVERVVAGEATVWVDVRGGVVGGFAQLRERHPQR